MRDLRPFSMLLVVLCLAVVTVAQAAPAQPPAATRQRLPEPTGQSQPAAAVTVAPTAPVITVHGFCPASKADRATDKSECKTIITRAEFEQLANTFDPNMPQQVRRQLANQYPSILYKSEMARQRGLDKDAHYLEMLKFLKMELLTRELDRSTEAEVDQIQPAEIKDYYEKNAKSFEQASLERILVPKPNQFDPSPGANANPAGTQTTKDEEMLAKIADSLHARAAANENFDKLQQAAYEAAGYQAPAPPTLNPKVRRAYLPASEAAVFDFEPGQLSPVFNEPRGFYFYRLVSKNTLPLSEVSEEIRNILRGQRLDALRQERQSAISYELNKEYFGDAPPTGSGAKPVQGSAPPTPMRPAPAAHATPAKE
jgi:hypothetical protein